MSVSPITTFLNQSNEFFWDLILFDSSVVFKITNYFFLLETESSHYLIYIFKKVYC